MNIDSILKEIASDVDMIPNQIREVDMTPDLIREVNIDDVMGRSEILDESEQPSYVLHSLLGYVKHELGNHYKFEYESSGISDSIEDVYLRKFLISKHNGNVKEVHFLQTLVLTPNLTIEQTGDFEWNFDVRKIGDILATIKQAYEGLERYHQAKCFDQNFVP